MVQPLASTTPSIPKHQQRGCFTAPMHVSTIGNRALQDRRRDVIEMQRRLCDELARGAWSDKLDINRVRALRVLDRRAGRLLEGIVAQYAVLRVARSVIEEGRDRHPDFVFTHRGHPVQSINNTGWQCARGCVGLTQVRVHDLKHTFGRRLRAVGVPLETRKVLLGHKNGDYLLRRTMSRAYSTP